MLLNSWCNSSCKRFWQPRRGGQTDLGVAVGGDVAALDEAGHDDVDALGRAGLPAAVVPPGGPPARRKVPGPRRRPDHLRRGVKQWVYSLTCNCCVDRVTL